MTSLSRRDWFLLAFLTLAWGFNWPIMKIGVQNYPPLTFRALGMLIGLPPLWLAARMQGVSLALKREDLLPLFKLAIPNMLVWHTLIVYGVRFLSSGRAAILGYTMPVWAVLAGLVFFNETISRRAWFGIACAMGGATLLLSSEFGNMAGQPLGSLMVLTAAAGWGYGTVLMRRSKIAMPTLALTFWLIAIATVMLCVLALVIERDAWRMPNLAETGAILYNGIVIFGIVHVVWFRLARMLPPVASGLSVMMIPVLGVFSGAWLLGESPHWQDYAAMLLILIAMSSVLLKPRAVATT